MSPKNKGSYGKGKKDSGAPDAPPEDEFVTSMGRLGKALEPHAKTIVFATASVVAIAAALVAFQWWQDSKVAQATVLYQNALVLADVPIVPPLPSVDTEGNPLEGADADKAKSDAEITLVDGDGDGIPDEFPSADKRAEAVLERLDALEAKFGSTAVAAEARLLHATMLYERGDYDKAVTVLSGYAKDASNAAMRRLAHERLGYAMEAQALAAKDDGTKKEGLRQALDTFRLIQSDDEGPGRDRALYHEARLLSVLGEKEKAVAALEKALEIAPQSDLRYEINQRLVQLGTKE